MRIITRLKKHLKKSRYEHVLRVEQQALKLAEIYNLDLQKVSIAAILHDCAKGNEKYYMNKYYAEFTKYSLMVQDTSLFTEYLIHGVLGYIIAQKEYQIEDQEILNAIMYHSTGRVGMTDLEKIIYIADKTESARDYQGVEEMRQRALESLDDAILLSINQTIHYLINEDQYISLNTIKLRNKLLEEARYDRS